MFKFRAAAAVSGVSVIQQGGVPPSVNIISTLAQKIGPIDEIRETDVNNNKDDSVKKPKAKLNKEAYHLLATQLDSSDDYYSNNHNQLISSSDDDTNYHGNGALLLNWNNVVPSQRRISNYKAEQSPLRSNNGSRASKHL